MIDGNFECYDGNFGWWYLHFLFDLKTKSQEVFVQNHLALPSGPITVKITLLKSG